MVVSGGELLLQSLKQEQVRYIYGVAGDQWTSFLDVLVRKKDELGIEFIDTRHEAGAGHMADAHARITGKPGVCLGTVGPGAVNLVSGVYPAFADSVPLIVLTAQNQTWYIHPDPGCTQGLDQHSLFKPLVKWNAVVWRIDRIPQMVQWAFRVATSGRPGPVQLDFPSDILFGTIDVAPPLPEPPRYRALSGPTADPSLIGQAAALLVEAKFPLLFAGSGVLWAEAAPELVQLAEHLSAPVVTSVRGRGAIPEDHPLAFVMPGIGFVQALSNADVVLLVGSRLGDLTMWGRTPFWASPEQQKLIQLDIEPETIGKNRVVDLALVGDAKSTLRFLLEEVRQRTDARPQSPLLESCQTNQRAWLQNHLTVAKADRKPIHPLRLVKEVRAFFDRTAITIVDGGNTGIWCQYLNHVYHPRTFLSLLDSGQLGVGLPFAIGAKLAQPDRQVYLISGDGAFMLNIQELETAARHKAPIIAVIANDRRWGMIAGVQHLMFQDRFIGVDFTDVRYDKVAQAMGCYGERVTDPKEIRLALQRAVDSGLPAVLDVIIDRDANLKPPDLALIGSIWLEGCTPPPIEEKKEKKRPVKTVAP